MADWSGTQFNRFQGDPVQSLLSLRKGSYTRDDDIFCKLFLQRLCQLVPDFAGNYINCLQTGRMPDKCLLMDKPNFPIEKSQSGLSSFLHRGVEYLLSRLYSLNSVCQQSNELQPIPNCVNNTYNNAYNNSRICINPTHFNQVQSSSSFKPFDEPFQSDPFPSFPNEAFQSDGPVFSPGFNPDIIDAFTNDPDSFYLSDDQDSQMSPISQTSHPPSNGGSSGICVPPFGVQNVRQNQMQHTSPPPVSPQSPNMDHNYASRELDETTYIKTTLDKLRRGAKEQQDWCSISYYEFNDRVGEIWHASKDETKVIIDGFTQPNDGLGKGHIFSLGLLTNINRKPESDSARRFIGQGCCIYSEKDTENVYLQNQSGSSIFAQSIICNQAHSWHPATVVKIPAGCSIEIFSNDKYEELLCCKIRNGYEETYGLTCVCKIRISFVKGWGANYRRQTITACPCWVELRLNKPLGLLDAALQQLTPRDMMNSMT